VAVFALGEAGTLLLDLVTEFPEVELAEGLPGNTSPGLDPGVNILETRVSRFV
jgi:hypothetical protein